MTVLDVVVEAIAPEVARRAVAAAAEGADEQLRVVRGMRRMAAHALVGQRISGAILAGVAREQQRAVGFSQRVCGVATVEVGREADILAFGLPVVAVCRKRPVTGAAELVVLAGDGDVLQHVRVAHGRVRVRHVAAAGRNKRGLVTVEAVHFVLRCWMRMTRDNNLRYRCTRSLPVNVLPTGC